MTTEMTVFDPETMPGGRISDENDAQFLAWQSFRDSPRPRSIESAFQIYRTRARNIKAKRATKSFKNWFSDFGWTERAAEYDDYLDRQRRAKLEAKRAKTLEEVENIVLNNAAEIARASVKSALAGDPRSTKDLLDRIGYTRKASTGGSGGGDFIFNVENLSTDEIKILIQQLREG